MKIFRIALAISAFTFLVVQPSFARDHPRPNPKPPKVVPEIDPSLASGAMALVGGSLMIFRRGRIKS